MQFGLSEEQKLLGETLRRLLEEQAPLETVRAVVEGDPSPRQAIRQGLGELGIPGLLVPEAHGGLGLGFLDAAIVAERLGGAVAPVGWLAPWVIAPVAVAIGGSTEQRKRWLPAIARDELRLAAAISEGAGARSGAGVIAQGGRLEGEALFALDTESATDYLVADRSGGLHLVPADDPNVRETRLTTVDRTREFSRIELAGAEGEPLSGENAALGLNQALYAGRVAIAADILGAAQTMLDRAVAYAKERRQFGRVIGSFQAVKHLCAEMAAALEPCRAFIWHAAHALDAAPEEGPILACHVKAHLSEVGQRVARTATEVHGGMGFTDLLGLHYWFKRIGVNRQLLGGPERAREDAARLQGWL